MEPFIAATAQIETINLGFYMTNFCLGLQAFLWPFQLPVSFLKSGCFDWPNVFCREYVPVQNCTYVQD